MKDAKKLCKKRKDQHYTSEQIQRGKHGKELEGIEKKMGRINNNWSRVQLRAAEK